MKYFTVDELAEQISPQLLLLEHGLSRRQFSIQDIGDLMPGSVMVHALSTHEPAAIAYMNEWGCHELGFPIGEIQAMGDTYYDRFFVREETNAIMPGVQQYCQQAGHPLPYNFFQRVKTAHTRDLQWYYTTCKMLAHPAAPGISQLLMISIPVKGMGNMVQKVSRALSDQGYIAQHYRAFAALSKREKEIIGLLCEGKSSAAIAAQLFLSKHTIDTHRKNITRKLGIDSFAGLVRFAVAFELC